MKPRSARKPGIDVPWEAVKFQLRLLKAYSRRQALPVGRGRRPVRRGTGPRSPAGTGLAVQELRGGGVSALLPARIHAGEVVGVVVALAEGADRADAEVGVDVVAVAADRHIGLLVQLAEAGTQDAGHQHQGGGVARDDRAVYAAAGAAGGAQAVVRVGDLAGVEHVELGVK